jgi:DNA-binding MarR family transcriptional regulator
VDQERIEEWPLTALLRSARASVGDAIRQSFEGSDMDDLPPNGPFVIGAIARTSAPLGTIVRQLGGSKQAAGQLVDTLVIRGYLERSTDPDDRRRLIVRLTARGEAAAKLIRSATESLEAELELAAGRDRVKAARAVLADLVRMASTDA